jgi:hypothetical protein
MHLKTSGWTLKHSYTQVDDMWTKHQTFKSHTNSLNEHFQLEWIFF